MQMQPHSSNDGLQELRTCGTKAYDPFSIQPFMLLVAINNKHQSRIDDDFFQFKSLCQCQLIICIIEHMQVETRTDPGTGISSPQSQHNVAHVPFLPVLKVVVSGSRGPFMLT